MDKDKDKDKDQDYDLSKERSTEMDTAAKRPCTPTQSLANSLQEMRLIRQGKAKKSSWKELKANLNKEK